MPPSDWLVDGSLGWLVIDVGGKAEKLHGEDEGLVLFPGKLSFKVLMRVLGLTTKLSSTGQGLVPHVKDPPLPCIQSLLTSCQNYLLGWNLSLRDEFLLQLAPSFSFFLLPTSDSWGNSSFSKTIFSATWQPRGTDGLSLRYLYSWQLPETNCTFSVFVYSEPSTRPENSWCLI